MVLFFLLSLLLLPVSLQVGTAATSRLSSSLQWTACLHCFHYNWRDFSNLWWSLPRIKSTGADMHTCTIFYILYTCTCAIIYIL